MNNNRSKRLLWLVLAGVFVLSVLVFIPATLLLEVDPYFSLITVGTVYLGFLLLIFSFFYLLNHWTAGWDSQLDQIYEQAQQEDEITIPVREQLKPLKRLLNSKDRKLQNKNEKLSRLENELSEKQQDFGKLQGRLEAAVQQTRGQLSEVEDEVLEYISEFQKMENSLQFFADIGGRFRASLEELVNISEDVRNLHLDRENKKFDLKEKTKKLQGEGTEFTEMFDGRFREETEQLLASVKDLQELSNTLRLEASRQQVSEGISELTGKLEEEMKLVRSKVEEIQEGIEERSEKLAERRIDFEQAVEDLELKLENSKNVETDPVDNLLQSKDRLEDLLDRQLEELEKLEKRKSEINRLTTNFTPYFCQIGDSLDQVEKSSREGLQNI